MIEVTNEMREFLEDELCGITPLDDAIWDEARDKTISKIIEIHEQSKPKPEPVAWLVQRNGYENVTVSLSKDKAISYRHEVQMRSDLSGDLNAYHIKPLYTTSSTLQPLSDTSVIDIASNIAYDDMATETVKLIRLARAIEQAHGIKGNE